MEQLTMNPEEAYEYCARLTRRRESNFSLGFKILPKDKKRAIYVVYAACRFVDDLSDDNPERNNEDILLKWRGELDNVYEKQAPQHPIGVALLDVLKRFKVPREGIEELIAGCIQDQTVKTYETFEGLSGYCDLVATSIAKVSLPIYGYNNYEELFPRGRDLSFAFQLTNILRDVAEDYHGGRVYIPQEELTRFGLTAGTLADRSETDKIRKFYEFQVDRCRKYFDSGYHVLDWIEHDARPCVRAMHGAYKLILEKIAADPIQALQKKTELTHEEKTKIVKGAL